MEEPSQIEIDETIKTENDGSMSARLNTLPRGKRIIKNLTPEQVSRYIVQGVLVDMGHRLDGNVHSEVSYVFLKGNTKFSMARLDVVVL